MAKTFTKARATLTYNRPRIRVPVLSTTVVPGPPPVVPGPDPEFLDLFDDWGVESPTKTNLYTHHRLNNSYADEESVITGVGWGANAGFKTSPTPLGGNTHSFSGDPTEPGVPDIDFVHLGTTAWDFNDQDFTVVAFFHRDASESDFSLACKMTTTGIGAGWIMRIDNGAKMYAAFGDGVDGSGGNWGISWRFAGADTVTASGQWCMSAITWDTSEGRMRGYYGADGDNRIEQRWRQDDGVAMQNADLSNSIWGCIGAIALGTPGSRFWGIGPLSVINNVMVFNKVLTAGELEWVYDKLITKDEVF